MGRPKQPLVSRDGVVAVALRIIDQDGADALSTRRLARELNVTGPALYYHFSDMTEILTEVLTLVLSDVLPPPSEGIDWREWIITLASRTRDVLLKHPNVVPAMVYHVPRTMAPHLYEVGSRLMHDGGVPVPIILPMMEAVEIFTLGYVSFEVAPANAVRTFGRLAPSRFPNLRKALAAPPIDVDQRYRRSVESLLDGWIASQASTKPHRP
jgi:TetR/AcrR family tetracycline transcriptional repressor